MINEGKMMTDPVDTALNTYMSAQKKNDEAYKARYQAAKDMLTSDEDSFHEAFIECLHGLDKASLTSLIGKYNKKADQEFGELVRKLLEDYIEDNAASIAEYGE